MRIELCRMCGTEMKPCEGIDDKCPICKKSIKSACPNCRRISAPQFHQHLMKNVITA